MRAATPCPSLMLRIVSLLTAALLVTYGLSFPSPITAGGPIAVGGTFGPPGVPFTWDVSVPIPYRTDGGMLGPLTNPQANTLVQQMFQVWQDVHTSNIAYTRIEQIQIGKNHPG